MKNAGNGSARTSLLKTNFKCLSMIRLFVGLFLAGWSADARTVTIANTNDDFKINSLRVAVMAANFFGGNNTIVLDQTPAQKKKGVAAELVYHLIRSGGDEDKARTGDLDVTRGNLTIISPRTNVVIDATGLGDRVFQVFSNAHLTLKNITITGGTAPGNGDSYLNDGAAGGAIYNSGFVTMLNCRIIGNAAGEGNEPMGNGGGTGGGDGGGVYNVGTLKMKDCVVAGNASGNGRDGAYGGNGGGLKNEGACWLTNCVFISNNSGDGGPPEGNAFGFAGNGGRGGAIGNSGTMILNGCTISNNFSGVGKDGGRPGISNGFPPQSPGGNGGDGAGIYNSGELALIFCTINDNTNGNGGFGGKSSFNANYGSAGGNGAGIFNAGSATLDNCAITGNQGGNGGNGGQDFLSGKNGGNGGSGGGIYNAGRLTLLASAITANAGGNGGDGGTVYDAQGGAGGDGGQGGGLYNSSNLNALMMTNTVVDLNVAGLGGNGGSFINSGTNGVPGLSNIGPDFGGNY